LYSYLVAKKERVVLIVGELGSGKTILAKKFANYANEWKNFSQSFYLDFLNIHNFFEFKHELQEKI